MCGVRRAHFFNGSLHNLSEWIKWIYGLMDLTPSIFQPALSSVSMRPTTWMIFKTHIHWDRVQMKGNFQYWWAIPESKKKRGRTRCQERKSQNTKKPKDLLMIIRNRFFSCWIGWFYKTFYYIFFAAVDCNYLGH